MKTGCSSCDSLTSLCLETAHLKNMVQIRLLFLFLVGSTLIASCKSDAEMPPPEASEIYETVGVVKTITGTKNYVLIDHEEIPGYMSAMAMFFTVEDTTVVSGISVSDSVSFSFILDGSNMVVQEMTVIQ